MYFLSIDVANKSLAISFLEYNNILSKNVNLIKININNSNISNITDLININNNLNNIIKYYICEVIDLLPNKKVRNCNILERSNALKDYLRNLKIRIKEYINNLNISKITLLIENQPSFNDKSRTVFNQIIYAFSKNNIYKIKVMNPMYKNFIYFSKELKHYNFIKKYSNNYLANKNHTKENFLYFIENFNMKDKIKKIKKKNYDDIADSFMQIFGYIFILKKNKIM
jgi:hypothetical protein